MITFFIILALILLFPEVMGFIVGTIIRFAFVMLVIFGIFIAMGIR